LALNEFVCECSNQTLSLSSVSSNSVTVETGDRAFTVRHNIDGQGRAEWWGRLYWTPRPDTRMLRRAGCCEFSTDQWGGVVWWS